MAENKLQTYHKKRDFSVTAEPKGSVKRSRMGELRFSVQHHLARADHFDLRLEYDGVALSWAIPKGPSYSTADKRLAMRVEDHPVDYMDFEGVIPKGEYGGGTVMLWDEGHWIPRLDPEKGLKEGSLKFHLDGQRLKGDWALVRMKGENGSEPWLLIKERDGYAKKTAGISRFQRGVRSGKSMSEIAEAGRVNPFSQAKVMLAELCDALPAGKGWLYELKYDGHRTLGFSEKGKVTLKTRNGYDSTQTFRAAAEALEQLLGDRAAVVDGEMIVVGKDGIPDFGALQAYARSGGREGLGYVLFDLLALDGEDLRDRPLSERKERLKALLKDAKPPISYSEHTDRMTKSELNALRRSGMEGIVIKRADAPYTAGKNGDWKKLKFRNTEEFVIGGMKKGEDGELRSLLVGSFRDGKLCFFGKVGTGFSQETKKTLQKELEGSAQGLSPFCDLKRQKGAIWVKPVFAAQVEYAEITSSGMLRQASFKGLRRDKEISEITAERPITAPKGKELRRDEEAQVLGIRITHPEKAMFERPKVTKLALAEYYAAAAPRMLPYLKDRLLSLVCCPKGIAQERFFRKHLEGKFKGVGFYSEGEEEAFFYLKNEKGLIALTQYNAVEFHVQAGKKGARPDIMVFDIDPDEALPLHAVRKGVRELKSVLEGLGLLSFLKTSGGKGYHVVVPLGGTDGEKFRDFARRVAILMESAYPDLFTANMLKRQRKGKIFLDWQRNSPSATSAAPYSLRARDGAPVSMPIAWDELEKIAPSAIGIKSAIKRLGLPDPWEDFFRVKSAQRLLKRP